MVRLWCLALVVIATAACSAGRAQPQPPGPETKAPRDLTVRRGTFEDRFLLTGQMIAFNADSLFVPRLPNWQTTIRWLEAEGTAVKTGQKLVEFDAAAFAQDYGERRLALDQAVSDLAQTEADGASQKAEKLWQVTQKGIAVEKARIAAAIPAEFLRGKEYQDHQLALARAVSELDKAREDMSAYEASSTESVLQRKIALEKARREFDAAGLAREGMVLKAPRDGILVVADHPWQGRKIQVGDAVWVGLPVVNLPDLSAMEVEAKLSDVDDGRVAVGSPVTCTLDAFPDRPYAGRVLEITPVAQEAANRSLRRAYNVRVALDAPDTQRMRPGMSVKVEVQPTSRPGVLLAPRLGLDLTGARPRARLDSGNLVDVELGACNLDACVVLKGIEEGAHLKEGA